jgi:hypothetical protein
MLPGVASQGGGQAGSVPIGRLRTALLNAPLRWLGGGIAAIVLLVSGAFGGFDKVTPAKQELPSFTVDQAFEAGGWRITVHTVRALDELKPINHQEETGWRWIIVVATVELTDLGKSTLFYNKALQIHGIEGVPAQFADHVALTTDAKENTSLQPGVPTRLGYFWEQRTTAPIPPQVQVGIFAIDEVHDPGSGLDGWLVDTDTPRAVNMVTVDTEPAA